MQEECRIYAAFRVSQLTIYSEQRGRMIMANEKTLEILKKLKADPKAKELFDGMEKPKSLDEMVAAYAQIAEKLG